MKMTRLAAWGCALLAGLLCFPAAAGGDEREETAAFAYGAYLAGNLQEAERSYRYILTLQGDDAKATTNLGLILEDLGRPEEALPQWIKATMLDPKDAFAWTQRGWSYMALERYRQAREAFSKARELAVSSSTLFEAELGSGLLELSDGNRKLALERFGRAYAVNSFSASALYGMGLASWKSKKYSEAINNLRNSLTQDPLAQESQIALAEVYAKIGETDAAWQSLRSLSSREPDNPYWARRVEAAEKYVSERRQELKRSRRIAWPYLKEGAAALPPSKRLRVGLLAVADGRQASIQKMSFVSGSAFKIVDEKLGSILTGGPLQQWEILFRKENYIYEVRNPQGIVVHSSRQGLALVPFDNAAGVLVKNIESAAGPDEGDRELRGSLELAPAADGFKLVNHVSVEEHTISALSASFPWNIRLLDALDAHAVVTRTRTYYLLEHPLHSDDKLDLCDSRHCQIYPGVQSELGLAKSAVEATLGLVVKSAGKIRDALSHAACGHATEDGVSDAPADDRRAPASVQEMVLFTRGKPSKDLLCFVSGAVPPADIRWTRVLDASLVEERAKRSLKVGKLLRLIPGRRSASGRLATLRVVGEDGEQTLVGADSIERLLSPGTLRSTFFSMHTLYRGTRPKTFVLFGVGTGSQRGMCQAGAVGLASTGKKFGAILEHYFPDSELVKITAK
ncbi:MAG: tetratricopeptide repeat protein [Elusimicrobia bacterium]|nr:tetratricopeptide repeat protein [Elusimicrobiota bacterium]